VHFYDINIFIGKEEMIFVDEQIIKKNLNKIKLSLPEHVVCIAVSKTRTLEDIREVYELGIRDFGENKVQELIEKYDNIPKDVNWHIIGHLQRNKVKYIVGKVSLIQSLDSVRLLEEIEKQYKKANITANALVQINIGREESKTGIMIEELEDLLENIEKCQHVKVKGIMAIIPRGDEESSRRYFSVVREIWSSLGGRKFVNITMEYLSMGMSNDYEIAVQEGSNMVRIGEGIFGKRNYNKIILTGGLEDEWQST
jgi:PLP dependent protein